VRAEDLKKNILKMFRGKEFYGYEIHKKLASEDVRVEISRLYKVLNEMLRERLLEGRWEKSHSGPEKRVYSLSGKGREELDRIFLDATETIHAFYSEYLLSLPSKVSVFDHICRLLAEKLGKQSIIVYITPEYSAMHERMICCLHSKVHQAKIYLLKPRSADLHLRLDNLLFLQGSYEKVPLKDGYADLIVMTNIPENHLLKAALREWRRVLKESGRLAILTPTIFAREYKDPLTISDFIEKHEHEARKLVERVHKKAFRALLKNFFQKVEEKQIVHITIFSASEPHFLRNDQEIEKPTLT
jgi:DNA-binding PadR family transcriptional regulator